MMVLLADTLCCDSPLCPDQIGRNPGLQAIWEDEKQRRREKNQASQIETPESQGGQIHSGNCSRLSFFHTLIVNCWNTVARFCFTLCVHL